MTPVSKPPDDEVVYDAAYHKAWFDEAWARISRKVALERRPLSNANWKRTPSPIQEQVFAFMFVELPYGGEAKIPLMQCVIDTSRMQRNPGRVTVADIKFTVKRITMERRTDDDLREKFFEIHYDTARGGGMATATINEELSL